jgi:hypothetical protein
LALTSNGTASTSGAVNTLRLGGLTLPMFIPPHLAAAYSANFKGNHEVFRLRSQQISDQLIITITLSSGTIYKSIVFLARSKGSEFESFNPRSTVFSLSLSLSLSH